VGVLGPLKFPVGKRLVWGARIAAEEINAAGGVLVGGVKRPIKLVEVDTNELMSVPDAVTACERAITREKVDFVCSGVRTEAALAMQDVCMDYKKLFMLSGTAHPDLVKRVAENYDRYKYTFRLHSTAPQMFISMFDQLRMVRDAVKQQLGVDKPSVAILAEKAAWADPLVGLAKQKIEEMGMSIAGVWRPSSTATDVTAELTGIKSSGADIIFTFLSGPVVATYARQYGALKLPVVSVGMMEVCKRNYEASEGGMDYIVGWGSIGPVEITSRTLPFINKYAEMSGGEVLVSRHCESYSNIYIVKQAIEKAQSLDPDVLVATIEETDFLGPGGRYVFNPKGHELAHNYKWGPGYATDLGFQFQEGEPKVVWPPADGSWHGIVYKGTAEFKLPPWVKKR